MKMIITGATGSLGAALTKYFSATGFEIIAIGRTKHPPQNLLNCAQYLPIDINSPFHLPQADVIIHTAAVSDDKAAFQDLYQTNVIGTKHTVEAASHIPMFIHISSSSVYLPSYQKLTEEMAGKQNNRQLSPYGKSKLLAEEMLKERMECPACFILRPRALYGPSDKVIVPRMLKIEKHGKLYRPGKMEVKISMTHYANLIHAVECCLNSDKKGINTYNVADDETYVLIDIIRKLTRQLYHKSLTEKQIPITFLKVLALFKINGMTPLLIRTFTRDMVLDLNKIKSELNYQPNVNFDSALNDLVVWIQSIGGVEELKKADNSLAWK